MESTTDDLGVYAAEAQAYYRSVGYDNTKSTFIDLDDAANLDGLMHLAQSGNTQSFVVDFSDAAAFASFEVPQETFSALLDAERPECLHTRWINIYNPQHHGLLLESIAKRYDFSPRLLALMSSEPYEPHPSQSRPPSTRQSRRRFFGRHSPALRCDIEKGVDELSEDSSISSYDSTQTSNLYKIIGDLWHYSSIDFGRNYICLGYNSLYGTKHSGGNSSNGPLPDCTRAWTWLVYCEDSTVISINEDLFPFFNGDLDPLQNRVLAETRRYILNVFRSLSTVDISSKSRYPMSMLALRTRLGDTPEETAHRESDAPGLLFYYLFENWHNTYTLITRRESRFGVELAKLRVEMFEAPKLCHIDRLDGIGKELGVLKRHYESYKRIIYCLLEPPAATAASLQNSRIVSDASQASLETVRPLITERESMLGVSLSSAARVRFKRLNDLIDLYALSEIEEYIKQKDSLVTMNFNLIAIKESLDVERLTRITLLLTKVTILFLPVSFMTTYFSVPLQNTVYTSVDYWVSFAVILFMSWGALFVFGVISGSVQTATFFRALSKGYKACVAYLAAWM